ncbi:hypothetical protein DBV15_09778 [Temnothorax longispinosus]|uniref:Uncharacterized protein n=1 Tax=Temnothorax longispinosus TaxID=300112 RepID=A0A4S2KJA9_9HYME|nr:hypothetical protein DBV15_09778 [Temnothorax longispinosus]
MRRKPRNGEGDQIERITPGESRSSGVGDGTAERSEGGVGGGGRGEGFCVHLSRERDCTMVGPLYRDPRSAAQLLISSTAHQSLVHDPPRNLARRGTLEGYLETADGPRSEERRRGQKRRRGKERGFDVMLISREPRADEIKSLLYHLHLFELLVFEIKPEDNQKGTASKEECGERVPMSQYLDRRSRQPVPTLRSDRQPGLILGPLGPGSLLAPSEDRSRYPLVKGLAHTRCFVSTSNVLREFEAATLFSPNNKNGKGSLAAIMFVKFQRAVSEAQKGTSRTLDDNVARKLSRLELSSVSPDGDGGGRRRWWCSCSSILFNLPRYREMHSIAISPGVEDSAHLRTLSFPPPAHPPPSTFALSFQRVAEEGVGALEGSCIQLITPPGLITSRPGSRPTVQPTPVPRAAPPRPRRAAVALIPWNPLREFPAEISMLLSRERIPLDPPKSFFPARLIGRQAYRCGRDSILSLGRAGERGIALESVWTPASWPSPPPPPPSTPVAVVDKRRATKDIWIPAMRYNASVVRPPRERERFRMSESRDAADTEMLSANAPVWPGNGGSPTGILRRPSRFSSETLDIIL